MSDEPFAVYTVYVDPADYPGRFVVRRFLVTGAGAVPDQEPVVVASTLDIAREMIPPGLDRLPRQPDDDPVILEVWL